MRNIILATAVVFTMSSPVQANIIINELSDIKMDIESGIQDGKDQLARNKVELTNLFVKVKGFVIAAKDKIEGLNDD